MPEGVAFITTREVPAAQQAAYQRWTEQVVVRLEQSPGYLRAEVIPSVAGERSFWTQIATFDSREAALGWERSPQLAELLESAAEFSAPAEVARVRTGESGYLSYGLDLPQAPPTPARWKQLLAALLVLYPTVFVLTALQELAGIDLPVALKVLLTNAVAISLVMLVWMPLLSRALRRWLMGETGAGPTWTIALLMLVGLLVLLLLFSLVQTWL